MAVGPRIESVKDLKGIYIYVPYSEFWIADFKALVPYHFRHWDGDYKRWYVFESYADEAIELTKRYYPLLDTSGYGSSAFTEGWDYNATKTKRRWIDADGVLGPWQDIPDQRQYRQQQNWNNANQQTANPPLTDFTKLYVLPNAPPEVIRAAYKALALLYHPDKGGNETKMKDLNSAMDRLKKEGKA